MAKVRAAERREDDTLKRDVIAVALATLGALLLVSLVCRDDALGVLPTRVALALRLAVGLGAYVIPPALFALAGIYGFEGRPITGTRAAVGIALLVVALLILLQVRLTAEWELVFAEREAILSGGGYVGAGAAFVLLRLLGPVGTYIFVVGIAFVGVVLLSKSTMRDLLASLGNAILHGGSYAGSRVRQTASRPRPRRRPAERPSRPRARRERPGPREQVDLNDDAAPIVEARPVLYPATPDEQGEPPAPTGAEDDIDIAPRKTGRGRRTPRRASRSSPKHGPGQPALLSGSDLFTLPRPSLLSEFGEEIENAQMREEAAEQIIKLEDTLASFGITAKVSHYERGPVLTRYEVEPERGIRVNQVVRLADDLAMALAAVDVRVEAPIPGKSAIGIEVPNETRATVGLRRLLEDEAYQQHPSRLAFALGRDIAGHPVVVDLETMPHLLIAGATGSGKSVCLHSLILSLLMRATPEQVRLMMIDPKRVELAVYDGIPHLMAPVVHSVKQAADVLRKAIREMEKRYDKFALKSVVNLAEYNALAGMPKEHATDEFDALPHVVIVIDELADLMMQARAEFEFSICRIAQLARATGIHLVLATQRPSVKVVTGNIKANIPSRVALAVASQVDSRTILDGQGAERLIGRGDMLYSPLDASKPRRIQGAFVPRGDIEAVVEHLRAQGEPEFDIIPEAPEDDEGDSGGDIEASDELYAAAVQYVVQEQEASVSMIQRRFKVGYARAGRLIDMMERRGVIGPHEGSKPRQVFVGPHMVEATLQGRRPQGENGDGEPEADFGDARFPAYPEALEVGEAAEDDRDN